jgi:hypothetical protein
MMLLSPDNCHTLELYNHVRALTIPITQDIAHRTDVPICGRCFQCNSMQRRRKRCNKLDAADRRSSDDDGKQHFSTSQWQFQLFVEWQQQQRSNGCGRRLSVHRAGRHIGAQRVLVKQQQPVGRAGAGAPHCPQHLPMHVGRLLYSKFLY